LLLIVFLISKKWCAMSIVSSTSGIISKSVEGRFAGKTGQLTRQLNKIALKEMKGDKMMYTFSKAAPEDLKRLTSKNIIDSHKRVTWTNPKDNKVYHILEEGRKNGKIQVRILDKDGAYVKDAELEPKTIVIFDQFFSPRGVTHGEMMEAFVKRFNPFATVERLEHKKGLYEQIKYRGKLPINLEVKRFKELEQQMENGKKVDYISVSEDFPVIIDKVLNESGKVQKEFVSNSYYLKDIKPVLENISSKGTRILMSAGNDVNKAARVVNDRLAVEGVEGVGSLVNGKIAKDSCSRNSIFTQHYDCRNYNAVPVKDENGKILGINVTGTDSVDLPVNRKTKKLIGRNFGGTSYSTPKRVAQLSLCDMMEGIL